jgi:hypothetical protein
LNAIWEGSGNVIALDVLRAARNEPESVEALFIDFDKSLAHLCSVSPVTVFEGEEGNSSSSVDIYTETIAELRACLINKSPEELNELQFGARAMVDRLAICLQASTLIQRMSKDGGDDINVLALSFLKTRFPARKANSTNHYLTTHSVGAVAGAILEERSVKVLIDRLKIKK